MIVSSNKYSSVLGETWGEKLTKEFEQEYMVNLSKRLIYERETKAIYPSRDKVFSAFKSTPYEKVRVVILGQDPYINGEAHGLAFSSQTNITPSLRVIYKEILDDVPEGYTGTLNPNLSHWAEQGVFLLNTILTVEAKKSLSHSNMGWESFTLRAIRELNSHPNRLVFLLWGRPAKAYISHVDTDKHLVLCAAHPAAEAYGRGGFLGCRHFSKTNEFLEENYNTKIKWL